MKFETEHITEGIKDIFTATQLSNGQYAYLEARVWKCNHHHEYNVALCIADTLEECIAWSDSESTDLVGVSTGKCGLEGLRWGLAAIAHLYVEHMVEGDSLYVSGNDDKRHSAYRRLLRYGFQETWNGTEYVLVKESN